VFSNWWLRINTLSLGLKTPGLSSLITSGFRMLWKHPNDCVLNGAARSVQLFLVGFGRKDTSGAWPELEAWYSLLLLPPDDRVLKFSGLRFLLRARVMF
jgi:hypothetical protein